MWKSLSCKKKKYINLDPLSTDFSLLHPQIQFLYSPLKCMKKERLLHTISQAYIHMRFTIFWWSYSSYNSDFQSSVSHSLLLSSQALYRKLLRESFKARPLWLNWPIWRARLRYEYFFRIYLIWMSVLTHICMCSMCMLGAHRSQKRVSDHWN